MPLSAPGLRTTKHTHSTSDDDPYVALVTAIVHRAVQDAQGHCMYPGSRTPDQIEVEARAWLADARALADLLELAGYDAAPVVRRVQRRLDRPGTP